MSTLLYVAIQQGQLECARLLLDRGAAVDKARAEGATPLIVAAWKNQKACAELLLSRGAQIDKASDVSVLIIMCCFLILLTSALPPIPTTS